ncbi:Ig-like domain-containing protein [Aquimarina sp. 2304DJ70-9]|uniref:Ig-like domain-containing protein n=1 Tax=Aquimarina penaris TaxID=3231044 RepID=UPI00346200BE
MMSTQIKNGLFFLVPLLVLLFVSCRSDKEDFIEVSENKELKSNSKAAELIRKTTMNDGSRDNILDGSSCFTIALPLSIDVNDVETNINTEQDFQIVEQMFNEFEDDKDEIDFIFPITIVLSDFSEIFIEDDDQWKELVESCEENEGEDEDIECIDFVYPITVSVFNPETEIFENITFTSDKEFFDFIEDLDNDDVVNINFPVSVILHDTSEMVINDLDELEEAIESAIDDCQENDYTAERFIEVLTSGSFVIQEFLYTENEVTDDYENHTFNFYSDKTSTVTIEDNVDGTPQGNVTITINGTWSVSTSAFGVVNITLDFGAEAPLNKLNTTWSITEINDKKMMLYYKDENGINNELFFEMN